jgi:23S rRNA pseudouridine1911/1915/1917 synthase
MKLLDSAVIYLDNHLLVVCKPAGIPTQPDLADLAKAWVKAKYKKPGNVFLEPVHRLDKPVSGLVLFARTSKALTRLQEMMRQRQIVKIYHARVENAPKEQEGTLTHFLVHDDFRARIDPQGKEATLHYCVLEKNVLEIRLETGRYHQIRVQLAAIGCPVVGDKKYGAKTPFGPDAIALEHVRMEFVHPVTHQSMIFKKSVDS